MHFPPHIMAIDITSTCFHRMESIFEKDAGTPGPPSKDSFQRWLLNVMEFRGVINSEPSTLYNIMASKFQYLLVHPPKQNLMLHLLN